MPTTYSSSHTGAQIDSAVDQLVTTPILRFSNVTVSNWGTHTDADLNSAGYTWRGTAFCNGVTASHVPTVIFGYNELVSGNYAPYADSTVGGVYIYSKVSNNITIPTILCV